MMIPSLSKVNFPESAGDNRDIRDNRGGRLSRSSPIVTELSWRATGAEISGRTRQSGRLSRLARLSRRRGRKLHFSSGSVPRLPYPLLLNHAVANAAKKPEGLPDSPKSKNFGRASREKKRKGKKVQRAKGKTSPPTERTHPHIPPENRSCSCDRRDDC